MLVFFGVRVVGRNVGVHGSSLTVRPQREFKSCRAKKIGNIFMFRSQRSTKTFTSDGIEMDSESKLCAY
jgi:hypothetical protein